MDTVDRPVDRARSLSDVTAVIGTKTSCLRNRKRRPSFRKGRTDLFHRRSRILNWFDLIRFGCHRRELIHHTLGLRTVWSRHLRSLGHPQLHLISLGWLSPEQIQIMTQSMS
jgi:hypothetical protein